SFAGLGRELQAFVQALKSLFISRLLPCNVSKVIPGLRRSRVDSDLLLQWRNRLVISFRPPIQVSEREVKQRGAGRHPNGLIVIPLPPDPFARPFHAPHPA